MKKLLNALLLMGASSAVTIVVGIIGSRVIAQTIGETGIGLVGLLSSALTMLALASGLGLGSSGISAVAAVRQSDPDALGSHKTALLWATRILGMVAGLLVLVFHQPLVWVLNLQNHAALVWWLAPAVLAAVALSGQVAWLNGFERLAAIARVNALGASLGGLLGIGAVLHFGIDGLGAVIMLGPTCSWVLAYFEAKRIRVNQASWDWKRIWQILLPMVKLGFAIAAAVSIGTVVQFGVRLWLERRLGLEATGFFQAAWNISHTYMGFILGALATEFFPRISAFAHQTQKLNAALNLQIRSVLLIATPVILLMIWASPYLIALVYEPSFRPSVEILRWQLVGDVLKIPGWVFGFALMALLAKNAYFFCELLWNVAYFGSMVGLVSWLGLNASGQPYLLAYLVYFFATWFAVRHKTRFNLEPLTLLLIALSTILGIGFTYWLEQ
jgi:enterobacterial common antigen flippase